MKIKYLTNLTDNQWDTILRIINDKRKRQLFVVIGYLRFVASIDQKLPFLMKYFSLAGATPMSYIYDKSRNLIKTIPGPLVMSEMVSEVR